MFIGDGAKMVRDAFALAKEKQPCIIFIDEIDSIGAGCFEWCHALPLHTPAAAGQDRCTIAAASCCHAKCAPHTTLFPWPPVRRHDAARQRDERRPRGAAHDAGAAQPGEGGCGWCCAAWWGLLAMVALLGFTSAPWVTSAPWFTLLHIT